LNGGNGRFAGCRAKHRDRRGSPPRPARYPFSLDLGDGDRAATRRRLGRRLSELGEEPRRLGRGRCWGRVPASGRGEVLGETPGCCGELGARLWPLRLCGQELGSAPPAWPRPEVSESLGARPRQSKQGLIPIKRLVNVGNIASLSGLVTTEEVFFPAVTAMSIFENFVIGIACQPGREMS
jgi:hypothetical protein